MIKIKTNLFESLAAAFILPTLVFVITTVLLIISLFTAQEQSVYRVILIAYAATFFVLAFSIAACVLISKRNGKEFIVYDGEFEFLNHKYSIGQIRYCEYYVCKWYALPIVFFYKKQAAGLIVFKLDSGKKIQFKILYRDYLKIKNHLPGVIEK